MMFPIPFLTAFIVAVVLSWFFSLMAKKHDRSSASLRKVSRTSGMVRLGGVAMGTAFILAVLSDKHLVITADIFVILSSVIAVLIFGLWDDLFRPLNWKIQLAFQIFLVTSIFLAGITIHLISNPITGVAFSFESGYGWIISYLLVLFWIILVINSVNWMDGVDGLAGGISIIVALSIFFLSFKPEVNQPPMAILSIAFVGAVAGFLIFNFHPSKIFAGTGGSYFMGLVLALMAISAGTKIATALLVLSVPIVDFIWVITERLKSGRSIFKGDKNHLHHKLMKIGWSQKKICLYAYGFTALVAIIALNTRAWGKMFALSFLVALISFSIYFINKKIRLRQEQLFINGKIK
jgi:UDP-GlcNAc:undecaprenyl-phosphate/decaprenyl-phosphate GlcNAc-1-phosphate transferase